MPTLFPPDHAPLTTARTLLQALPTMAHAQRRGLQLRSPSGAPAWLDMALAAALPQAGQTWGRDLVAAMMAVGDDYGSAGYAADTPHRAPPAWGDGPQWHLHRVGAAVLSALGASTGIREAELPAEPEHSAYAASTRLALQWLGQHAEALFRTPPPHPGPHVGSGASAGRSERWGFPLRCPALGPVVELRVLLATGPQTGALARLRMQAVQSTGADLALAPVPACACLLLDADFGRMVGDLRSWLHLVLTNQHGLNPLQNTALAWDLCPAVGEEQGFAAIDGDSAGAAFACAALQALAAYAPATLRADLAQSHHVLGQQFMSAALTARGGLRPVRWIQAKAQAVTPLARWAERHLPPGAAKPALYLAQGQTDLELLREQLPDFCPTSVATVAELVQHMAQGAEHLSMGQRAFLQAWYTPAAHRTTALGEDYAENAELPESVLNPLVNCPADNPVRTLRQGAMQGLARWQRQAGGRLQHQFVPLAINPESGRRFGLGEQWDPYEHLQTLLAALDTGAHQAYLLTGLPGAGKSVLLRRHMLELCRALLANDALPDAASTAHPAPTQGWQEAPVYIPLNRFTSENPPPEAGPPSSRPFAQWWADQARAEVLYQLQELGWQAPMLAPFARAEGADNAHYRWRWHLDGLNELPMPPADPDQDRGERARWVVQGFLDAFKPALKPLLSVRSAHFDSPDWLTVNVMPWQPRHIAAYVRKFFAQHPPTADTLWAALANDAALMDLCARPMHLHMQCELAEVGFVPVASDRAGLYLAHLWLRLKRGLGYLADKAADDRLAGDDLLSAADRKAIKNTQPGHSTPDELRRLPRQGLLLRGLMQQAESQYWQDAARGCHAQERCKVAVDVDLDDAGSLALVDSAGQPHTSAALQRRWLQAASALGLVETNLLETKMAFSHQSWGEFFASLRLLDTPPNVLAAQAQAGLPGAQEKWARAMERPFAHLDNPVSAEAERHALRQRVNQCWAPALPHLQQLLQHTDGRLTVDMDVFKADPAVQMQQAHDTEVVRRFTSLGYTDAGLLHFDLAHRRVSASLQDWSIVFRIPAAVGLHKASPWAKEGAAWQALLDKLFSCFENQVWQHLRAGGANAPGMSETVLQQLKEAAGFMALPAQSDVQEVLNLALQGLPQRQAEAWLAAWLAQPPHTHARPHAWRVLAPAALALRTRLEPPVVSAPQPTPQDAQDQSDAYTRSGVTELGLWHHPHPLLQHLRRWLLLSSVDAGHAVKLRITAAGLCAALEEPIASLPGAIEASWTLQTAAAFQGEGMDLLLRLQAGLLLGELGDNLRYERHSVPVTAAGQPQQRTGIRLKATHWATVPASGGGVVHRVGGHPDQGDTLPAWVLPPAAVPEVRFACSPVLVMQWLAYADDLRARALPVPRLRALESARHSNPLLPITTLNFFQAQDFSAWAAPLHRDLFPALGNTVQLALPTEVQHEAAIRYNPAQAQPDRQALWPHDPSDQRQPEELPPDLLNHDRTRWGAPAPVGVFSQALTPTGIEAMGNVWTWCSNAYKPDWRAMQGQMRTSQKALSTQELTQLLADDANLTLALRGGAFDNPADLALAACRSHLQPRSDSNYFGLRWLASPHL